MTKPQRIITSPQGSEITVKQEGGTQKVLNFCANNYLGLANDSRLVAAARETADIFGYGVASVRFICGTLDVHRALEKRTADFLGYDDAITFAACFDANAAVFESLLGKEDAIISDALNHASIIDGVRLCKAQRFRYRSNSMDDLELQLKAAEAAGARTKMIVTDGVFSMDGTIANLEAICALAKTHEALVLVDDSHSTGVLGENGRGTPECRGVEGRVDIITGTYGKALGGGMGGFICARQNVVDLLRQRARPYLFSNALTPSIAGAAKQAIDIVENGRDLRTKLTSNAVQFRDGMAKLGFELIPGNHPIIPVMLFDAKIAGKMAERLLEEGIYVIGFSYPVVPNGQARIRVQISAAHSEEQINKALAAFEKIGRELKII